VDANRSHCGYPLWEVCCDECVLEIPRDTIMTSHVSQGRDIVRQDRRDFLWINQIIAVLDSFLSRYLTRLTCSWGGCFHSSHQWSLYTSRHNFLNHKVDQDLFYRFLYYAKVTLLSSYHLHFRLFYFYFMTVSMNLNIKLGLV